MATTITFEQARAQLFPKILNIALNLETNNGLLKSAIKGVLTQYAYHSTELCKRALVRCDVSINDSGANGEIAGHTASSVINVEFPVAAWGRHARFDVTERSLYSDKLKELVETILFEVGNVQRQQQFRDLDRNTSLSIINWGKKKAEIELENDFLFLNGLQRVENAGVSPSKLYEGRLAKYRGNLGNMPGFIDRGSRTRHRKDSQLVTEELYAFERVSTNTYAQRFCKILEGMMVTPSSSWQQYSSDVTANLDLPGENLSLYLASLKILEQMKKTQGTAISAGTAFTRQMLSDAASRMPLKATTKVVIENWLKGNNVELQL